MIDKNKKCSLCGGDLPSGWPVVVLPAGLAHRMKTMCANIPPETQAAIHLLEKRGFLVGREFSASDAVEFAGTLTLGEVA